MYTDKMHVMILVEKKINHLFNFMYCKLKIGPFGRFSQVGQQVQIMHDAFHDDDDCKKVSLNKIDIAF